MIINFSLNDDTQKKIVEHLEITSNLLSKVSTELSGKRKESKIYVMPDLGIAQNGTRMLGGFYTGACYMWDSDVPFVPVDATVNVCGTAIYKLTQNVTPEEFQKRLDKVMKDRNSYKKYATTQLPPQILNSIDINDETKFFWNYNVGNHFAILAEQKQETLEIPAGQYMIVHASAIELKKDNFKYGLYPVPGNWYYDDIDTMYDENTNRYLRYIKGDTAIKFFEIANMLQKINKNRNKYFCKQVLGELCGEEIINLSHYGMPNNNSVCIGCQWEQQDFTLLTAPGNDIYLVHPNLESVNTIDCKEKRITLTPHGCGTELKNSNDIIKYTSNGIIIGNKFFKKGQSINIGKDVNVRTINMNKKNIENYVQQILNKCPGQIYGQMKQLFARTKYGDFDYSKKEN